MFKRVSKNFYWHELFRTNTGLNNDPLPEKEKYVNENLYQLVLHTLQPIRDILGRVKINSGFRSEAVNNKIGGASNSQHRKGQAVDIVPIDISVFKGFENIKNSNIPFDQLIYENHNGKQWVHVSYNKVNNRRNIMSANWNEDLGRMEYKNLV